MSRDELCVFMVLTGKDERKVFFVESSLWLSCSLAEPDGRIFGSQSWLTDLAARVAYVMTVSQIFSSPALPFSQYVHLIEML